MKKALFILSLMGLFIILSIGTIQAAVVGDILVGTSSDTIGLNQVNLAWGGWGSSTTISGVTCRTITGAGAPTASQLTISTTTTVNLVGPAGGTIQVTIYNTSGTPTSVAAYINYNDGGTWQDFRLQDLTVPVGVWTTLNFEVCSAGVYTALSTLVSESTSFPLDCDNTLTDGFQLWFSFGGGNGGGPPPPGVLAVSEIKMVTSKSWTFPIGVPSDLNFNSCTYLSDTLGWSNMTTIAGVNCRYTLGNYTSPNPTINPIFVTPDPDIQRMLVTYYNGFSSSTGFSLWVDYADGSTWQDFCIGTVLMTGSPGWKTAQLNLAPLTLALQSAPASVDARQGTYSGGGGIDGIQIRLRPWDLVPIPTSSTTSTLYFTQVVPIVSITLDDQPFVSSLSVSPTFASLKPLGNVLLTASGGTPPYSWTTSSGVGYLSSTTGASVTFTANNTTGSSLVTVTDSAAANVSANIIITPTSADLYIDSEALWNKQSKQIYDLFN